MDDAVPFAMITEPRLVVIRRPAFLWCRYKAIRSTMQGAHTDLGLDQTRTNRCGAAPVIGSTSAAALRSIEFFFYVA
jgi:hypothetical protein